MLLLFLCLLAHTTLVQSTSEAAIDTVDGYELDWLRSARTGTTAPTLESDATDTPAFPLSMRTVYRHLDYTFLYENALIVEGGGLNINTQLKLVAPSATDCTAYPYNITSQTSDGAVVSTVSSLGTSTAVFFDMPVDVEIPHNATMPWICVCTSSNTSDCPTNGTAGSWIFTNMKYSVVPPCVTNNGSSPYLCEYYIANATGPDSAYGEVGSAEYLYYERLGRSYCCGYRAGDTTDSSGNVLVERYGICINPAIDYCCNNHTDATGIAKPFDPFNEKCCNGGNYSIASQGTSSTRLPPDPVITAYLTDGYCPCQSANVNAHCNAQYPDAGTSNDCCVPTKYSELVLSTTWGACYDGTRALCCDTGDTYDPGTSQCCTINGVQDISEACPCSSDDHCSSAHKCCTQYLPTPTENTSLCSIYNTYPTGTGSAADQPCLGTCISTAFQICCNGQPCVDQYESCCNNTCCNKHSQTCTIGTRYAAGSVDLGVPFEFCTTTEALTVFKGAQAYAVPSLLLFASYLGLAFTLYFSRQRHSRSPFTSPEKSLCLVSALAILLSCPFYFSPLFKYGVVTCWASFFVILTAFAGTRSLNITTVLVLTVVFLYLVDPFYGSQLFTFASSDTAPVYDSVHGYSGVLGSVTMLYLNSQQQCTDWYNFFTRDSDTEDNVRLVNPLETTFGLCERSWLMALGICGALLICVVVLQIFLTVARHVVDVLSDKVEQLEANTQW